MTDQQNRFLVAVGRIKVETNLSVTWVWMSYSGLENEILCLIIKYCINHEANKHNKKTKGGLWYDEFIPLIIQACDMSWKKIKKAWEKSHENI